MTTDTIAHPFGEFVADKRNFINGGDQYIFKFPNGYGASVVRHSFSYGSEEGKWELGVLGPDGKLTYDTPITDDVIGWLDPFDVGKTLDAIARLEPAAS